jgi:hypothetical protein
MNRKLESLKKVGRRGHGQAELIKYWTDGLPLTQQQAIRAKCYECSGYYADGAEVCIQKDCPLWPYMPYNTNRKKVRVKKALPKGVVQVSGGVEWRP